MRLQRRHSIPAPRVRRSPAPGAAGPSPLRSDHAAGATLAPPPGAHGAAPGRAGGAGTNSVPGGGRGLPAGPLTGSPRTASGSRRGAARGGARRRKGGRRRARGVPRAATPPPRASLSNPPHYLDSGLPVTAAANGRASLGRRSESELEGVSCVPRSRGNLQVGMEKGRGWELGTRFVFQLVEILLFLSLALSFRSASWPGRALPPHGREQLPLGARHCGGCSPGMRKKRHVLVAGPHLLWIRTTPLRGNQRALWS